MNSFMICGKSIPYMLTIRKETVNSYISTPIVGINRILTSLNIVNQKRLIPNKFEFALRVIIALILLQTLRFKFLGHQDSIHLFNQVSQVLVGDNSIEALLRWGTGLIELVASILLFIKPTILYGALIAAFTMAGAIQTHLFIIGINFKHDGGLLFTAALITFIASFTILFSRRDDLPIFGKFFLKFRDKFG